MSDYIKRESALAFQNELEPVICKSVHSRSVYSATRDDDLVRYINSIPAADVAPVVHGHWRGEYDGYADGNPCYDMWFCSECDYCVEDDEYPEYNYCPSCGAKMDGDGDV